MRAGSRKATAVVVLIFLLAALGYGGVVCVGYFMNYLEDVSKTKQKKQEEKLLRQDEERRKAAPVAKASVAELPKIVVPEEPPTAAGEPRKVGNMEVLVFDASLGFFDQSQTEERLLIVLKLTNHSKQRMKYRPWSDPANKAEVRDGTPALTKYAPIGSTGKVEQNIEPGATIEDLLTFPRTPPLFGVELDLPLGAGIERFKFVIPREFIGRPQ